MKKIRILMACLALALCSCKSCGPKTQDYTYSEPTPIGGTEKGGYVYTFSSGGKDFAQDLATFLKDRTDLEVVSMTYTESKRASEHKDPTSMVVVFKTIGEPDNGKP